MEKNNEPPPYSPPPPGFVAPPPYTPQATPSVPVDPQEECHQRKSPRKTGDERNSLISRNKRASSYFHRRTGQTPSAPADLKESKHQTHANTSHQPSERIVIVQQPPVVLGPREQLITCPFCHAHVTTSVVTEANTKTHLFALLLCAFGCYLCSCFPYLVDSCQSQKHFCPNCRAYIGTFSD